MRISPTQPRKKVSVKRLIVTLAVVLSSTYTHSQVVTNTSAGHVVYTKHGGYTCEPAGASCTVPQSSNIRTRKFQKIRPGGRTVYGVGCPVADNIWPQGVGACVVSLPKRPSKTAWPKVVSAHIVLDSVQAKIPGNEHVKQCGQTGPNETCWNPSLRHIINHLYGTNKERCERDEGVPCQELEPCYVAPSEEHEMCRQWVPIGKPVFEDKTPNHDPPLISKDGWGSEDALFSTVEHHGCNYRFSWDETKQACSITVSF